MDNKIKRKKKDKSQSKSKRRKRSRLSPELKQKIKNIINIRINGTKGSNRIKTSRRAIPKRLPRDVASSSDDLKRDLQQLSNNYNVSRIPQVIQYHQSPNDIIELYQRLGDRARLTNGENINQEFFNRLRLIEDGVNQRLGEQQRLIEQANEQNAENLEFLENSLEKRIGDKFFNNTKSIDFDIDKQLEDRLTNIQEQLANQGQQLNEGSRVVKNLVSQQMAKNIKKNPKVKIGKTAEGEFKCVQCNKGFKREQDLKSHNTRVHKNDLKEVSDVLSDMVATIYKNDLTERKNRLREGSDMFSADIQSSLLDNSQNRLSRKEIKSILSGTTRTINKNEIMDSLQEGGFPV